MYTPKSGFSRVAGSLANLGMGFMLVAAIGLHAQTTYQGGSQGSAATWPKTQGDIWGSGAYIDATAFSSQGDICKILNYILKNNGNAGVIDARGVSLSQNCSMNPWNPPSSSFHNFPYATILLPAGTIKGITVPWTIPINTRVFGEGGGLTTLQACGSESCFSGSALIEMGYPVVQGTNVSSNCGSNRCFGIVVSDLTVDDNAQSNGVTFDGIDNLYAEELSYAKHVNIKNAWGTGLLLSTGPASQGTATPSHSGPYEDLFIAPGSSAPSTAACLKFIDGGMNSNVTGAEPRGVHGVTCQAANGTTLSAGIYLDQGGISIEDVHLDGQTSGAFGDGIVIGDNLEFGTTSFPPQSDVIFNVTGSGSITNLIHICANQVSGPCQHVQNNPSLPSDLSLLGLNKGIATNSIKDELTGTTLSDSTVGMYILGERFTVNGSSTTAYTRFTTSNNASVPSWYVGTNSSVTGSSCPTGSLYSRTTGTSGTTLWGCVNQQAVAIK
jgi:hypothetical protein